MDHGEVGTVVNLGRIETARRAIHSRGRLAVGVNGEDFARFAGVIENA